MIKSSENEPYPNQQHTYPPATSSPLKSSQIGLSVQKDAQCYKTCEKKMSDFCFFPIIEKIVLNIFLLLRFYSRRKFTDFTVVFSKIPNIF